MGIKKGDFVEIDYTGKIKEEDMIFDTTEVEVAKKSELYNPEMTYGPVIVCVGEKHLIKGLDANIEGKELGEYTFDLPPEMAFGKKDGKLLQLIPTIKFKNQNIMPQVGMQINVDGMVGTVKSVSGGRTILDFNHPLSGKELVYSVKIKRIVTDLKEKLDSLLVLTLNTRKEFLDTDIEGDVAIIRTNKEIPKDATDKMTKELKRLIPELKDIKYEIRKQPEPKAEKKE